MEIAVNSLAEDREMASLYGAAGVAEYWIANAAAKTIEVYRQLFGQAYTESFTAAADQSIPPAAIKGAVIDLSRVFT